MRVLWLFLPLLLSAATFAQGDAPRNVDRQKWERFNKMKPEEKERLRRLWIEFKALSPEEKSRIMENAKRLKKMSPEAREQIRKRLEKLPEQGRKRIDRMMDHAAIPPFLRPRLMESVRRHCPEGTLRRIKDLPPEAQKEEFKKIIMRFKHETIAMAIDRKLIPAKRIEEFHRLPLQEKWKITVESLRKMHGKARPPGK